MQGSRVTFLTAAVLLAAAAPAAAQPQGTPQERRDYVSSGAYLRDVEAAVAPAKARLIARTDQIERDSRLCRRAGFTVGGGDPDATTSAPNRTATGTLGLRPSASGAAGRSLRRARVRIDPTGGATRRGTLLRLPARRVDLRSGTRAAVRSGGAVRLRRGGRSVAVRDLRYVVEGTRVTVTGRIGARRVTVLRGRTTAARRSIEPDLGVARVAAARVSLTAGAARRLGRALGTRALRGGTFGRLSAAVDLGPVIGRDACAALPARPALALDLDETALSNYLGTTGDPGGGFAGQAGPPVLGTSRALAPVLDLYREARRRGVEVVFITARPQEIRPQTERNLRAEGYDSWFGLSMKENFFAESATFKTRERRAYEAQGLRIIVNAGDAQTDLDGGVAEAAFKLPNRFY